MIVETKLSDFLPKLKRLTNKKVLQKEDLLNDTFLLAKEGNLAMYYAPHNEYVNTEAKVVIIGITPGWRQMKAAFEAALCSLDANDPMEEMLQKAKTAARFKGPMRENLIQMLDACGLAGALDIATTTELFTHKDAYLHTTSIIKYPVFYKGKNYTGHIPLIDQSPMLKQYANHIFPQELDQLKKPALVIPLGKATENVIQELQQTVTIPAHTYVFGFPHPSGANGHRIKQFEHNRGQLIDIIEKWKRSS